ncbi:uncharacterized protein BJ212DRAFT_1304896 [Suillus subaureus]|uniref:Uncharacterized protein n=1 Tax=Suillus subaureus TaxID=48587 RepID=A0A9P7J4H2_9AGAM|nr:uncharacterized protein BJ212DRAFT_1304896 [Suillus subaureus]KAG1802317.1 hypothetical protein BJ212DRAFT_1304896 [Suillus subaureus]
MWYKLVNAKVANPLFCVLGSHGLGIGSWVTGMFMLKVIRHGSKNLYLQVQHQWHKQLVQGCVNCWRKCTQGSANVQWLPLKLGCTGVHVEQQMRGTSKGPEEAELGVS